ncbi:PEP-CTERM sorting domain-containing protein [bacterium]|nr:MAG: PEP-CTERM sorting domain-containing protein [bacterium]
MLLAPLVDYTLSFEYFSPTGAPTSATVTFLEQTYTVNATTTPQRFSQSFTTGGSLINSSRIVFQDLGTGANGAGVGIDNVSLLPTVAPVPEPATMAALGLGAAALLRRRKRGSR